MVQKCPKDNQKVINELKKNLTKWAGDGSQDSFLSDPDGSKVALAYSYHGLSTDIEYIE